MKRKKYNPERRAWKGKSHRKTGERVQDLREVPQTRDAEPCDHGTYRGWCEWCSRPTQA